MLSTFWRGLFIQIGSIRSIMEDVYVRAQLNVTAAHFRTRSAKILLHDIDNLHIRTSCTQHYILYWIIKLIMSMLVGGYNLIHYRRRCLLYWKTTLSRKTLSIVEAVLRCITHSKQTGDYFKWKCLHMFLCTFLFAGNIFSTTSLLFCPFHNIFIFHHQCNENLISLIFIM